MLIKRYDKDGDGKLDEAERAAWAEYLRSRVGTRRPPETRDK